MNPLPPIPIPSAQRWREFRIQAIPFLLFCAILAVVAMLWHNYVTPTALVGEVEIIRKNVASPKAGMLVQLEAASFQFVKAGDTIAHVITTDPKILSSSLAVIQAEINLLRLDMTPIMGEKRYELTYDRVNLDWMEQRVALAASQANLQLAENEFKRSEELFKDKIVSDRVFDQAKAKLEKFKGEVDERNKLVAQYERTLEELRLDQPSGLSTNSPSRPQDTMHAAIAVQEEKLRLAEAELSPIPLRVPMDGLVSTVYRRTGETIMAGEPILTITSSTSDRIIGYLRQPIAAEPAVGMMVQVRSRSLKRQVADSSIIQVGVQMEPISAALLSPIASKTIETGLPILVSRPPELSLRPGEVVDLILRPVIR